MSDAPTITGSCLCGTVRWQAQGPLSNACHCHCSMCRKAHAAPFATMVAVKAEGAGFTAGADSIARYRSSSSVERPFCARCGSVVPYPPFGDAETTKERRVYMPAGCLDGDPDVRSAIHIYATSKAPWYAITDGAPQHATYPASWSIEGYEPSAPVEPSDVAPRSDGSAEGSCLCGRVAYAIAPGPALSFYFCHCSRCRKARAAAHGANTFVDPARFRWLRGEDQLRTYKVPEAVRFSQSFCSHCGSGMPVVRAERAVVPAGTLDTPVIPADCRHIFVASKASWFEITDAHPQHAAAPT